MFLDFSIFIGVSIMSYGSQPSKWLGIALRGLVSEINKFVGYLGPWIDANPLRFSTNFGFLIRKYSFSFGEG